MNKLLVSFAPVALTLAASLFCSAAYAQQSTTAAQAQVSTSQAQPTNPANQEEHGLTRKEVYAQLVQAEKDGTIARLNATVYKGS